MTIDKEGVIPKKADGKCEPHMCMSLQFMDIYGKGTAAQNTLVKPGKSQVSKSEKILSKMS